MSRILFACSGNTCRSAMAEALAKRTFGPSHTVVSAGAECSGGDPPAKNAVIAMRENGIDIAGHRSNDINFLDLSTFDMIVIFQPSAAETITIPANVLVEHLAVMDPYGQPLEVYRTRLRSIECGIPRLYVADALRRKPDGSHLLGIYNKSAKEVEKQVVTLALRLGTNARAKATLGEAANLIVHHATKGYSDDVREIGLAANGVNRTWVDVKHRDDPARALVRPKSLLSR
jgi:protein-tyrosine-phosphatase